MEPTQKSTNTDFPTLPNRLPVPYDQLSAVQQGYVDYKAVSGLITTDDGIRKMTVDEFAAMYGVTRSAVYKARDHVPNFWDLVNERRKQIGTKEKLAKVHETWFLKAAKGEFQHMQLWLANFDEDFRMPTEKVQHSTTDSLAEAMGIARKRRLELENVQEGEVVE